MYSSVIFTQRTGKTLKNKIIINLSKDTPTEKLTELYSVLKTQGDKLKPLYAFNEDIEKLHERYEHLFKQIKNSSNLSAKQIEIECETLSRKYEFELEELSELRKVDYEIRLAKIKARASELKPVRRKRWIFRPFTNRAQNIIEERAELDAEQIHSEAEQLNDAERERLFPENDKKQKKHEFKRKAKKEFKSAITAADNADVQEILNEPPEPPIRKTRKDRKSEG